MNKITTTPFKALLSTYPNLDHTLRDELTDAAIHAGFLFDNFLKTVIALPAFVDVQRCLVEQIDVNATYIIDDILEYGGVDEHIYRLIVMKAIDNPANRPVRLILEHLHKGETVSSTNIIETKWKDTVIAGIQAEAKRLQSRAADYMMAARNDMDEALNLQAFI